MLRRLYDRTMALAGHRHAERALGVVSFAESSFFPIPPDVILAPMVLAQRSKAWRFALICTLTSVAGAVLAAAAVEWLQAFCATLVAHSLRGLWDAADEVGLLWSYLLWLCVLHAHAHVTHVMRMCMCMCIHTGGARHEAAAVPDVLPGG